MKRVIELLEDELKDVRRYIMTVERIGRVKEEDYLYRDNLIKAIEKLRNE